MRQLYHLEMEQRVSWQDATNRASKLSAPLAALLDWMLEPDVTKRATLDDVVNSEWVNLPLPASLQVCAGSHKQRDVR